MFTEWEKKNKETLDLGGGCGPRQVPWVGLKWTRESKRWDFRAGLALGPQHQAGRSKVVRAGRLSSAPCVLNSTDIPQITSTSRNQEQRELFSPFTDEVTEARGGEVTCSRSHLLQGRAKAIWLKSQPPHSILGERRGRLAGREAGRGDPPKSREATTNVKRRS